MKKDSRTSLNSLNSLHHQTLASKCNFYVNKKVVEFRKETYLNYFDIAKLFSLLLNIVDSVNMYTTRYKYAMQVLMHVILSWLFHKVVKNFLLTDYGHPMKA